MRTLKMSWNTEEGRLVCHWVELKEGENTQADSSPPQWVAQARRGESAAFSRAP